ncbi:hypothetical protein ABZ366_31250, partial [Streptomyces sp. NPDC005904]
MSSASVAETSDTSGTSDTSETPYAAESSKARRLGELREFLMSRRARITPEEAGLPGGGGRRRTPG